MSALLDVLVQNFGDDAVEMISNQFGVENKSTESALSSAIPMIISALTKNSSNPQGAEDLFKAVVKDHDGSILDQLSDFIPNYQESSGSGILRHVFGEKRGNVEDMISHISGMDPKVVSGFMEMLAPIVMGSLGKQQRTNNLDQGSFIDMLREAQKESVEKVEKKAGGLLSQFLDQDGDGDITDDLGRLAVKFLGNYFMGRK